MLSSHPPSQSQSTDSVSVEARKPTTAEYTTEASTVRPGGVKLSTWQIIAIGIAAGVVGVALILAAAFLIRAIRQECTDCDFWKKYYIVLYIDMLILREI